MSVISQVELNVECCNVNVNQGKKARNNVPCIQPEEGILGSSITLKRQTPKKSNFWNKVLLKTFLQYRINKQCLDNFMINLIIFYRVRCQLQVVERLLATTLHVVRSYIAIIFGSSSVPGAKEVRDSENGVLSSSSCTSQLAVAACSLAAISMRVGSVSAVRYAKNWPAVLSMASRIVAAASEAPIYTESSLNKYFIFIMCCSKKILLSYCQVCINFLRLWSLPVA